MLISLPIEFMFTRTQAVDSRERDISRVESEYESNIEKAFK